MVALPGFKAMAEYALFLRDPGGSLEGRRHSSRTTGRALADCFSG
jgi:hypothetical protein